MKRLDLNVDIGEGFPFDRQLLAFATSANVCCGEHAGTWELTKETVHHCLEAGVRIGMHPGYPDRTNMGRRPMEEEQWRDYDASVQRQVERFYFFVPAAYLKPHGALYNDAGLDTATGELARTIVRQATDRFRMPLMALPNSRLSGIARDAGVELIREGFADRAYQEDGALVPRTEPGAILHRPEHVRRQVLELAMRVDSICLHGDTPGCLEFAELVFATLADAGYEVGT